MCGKVYLIFYKIFKYLKETSYNKYCTIQIELFSKGECLLLLNITDELLGSTVLKAYPDPECAEPDPTPPQPETQIQIMASQLQY